MIGPVIAMVLAVVCALGVIGMIAGDHHQGGWRRLWTAYRQGIRDRSAFSSVRAEAAAIAEPVSHADDLQVDDLWTLSDEPSRARF